MRSILEDMARLRKARVKRLTLCPRGKNRLATLYKEEGNLRLDLLVKEDSNFEERGELLFVGYAPNHPDIDGHEGDRETCKDMAYSWAQAGHELDIRHGGVKLTKEQVYVAESFWNHGDSRFSEWKDTEGNLVDLDGAWVGVLKLEDPDLRQNYRSGKWNGVSLEGEAYLTKEDREDKALDGLRERLGSIEDSMDKNELEKLFKAQNDSLASSISEALKPLVTKLTKSEEDKPDDKKKPDPLAFVGSPTNPKHVARHKAKLIKAKLLKEAVDWSDPDAVEEHLQLLKANGFDTEGNEDADEMDDSVEGLLKQLKKEEAAAKTSGRSNRPAAKSGESREGAYSIDADFAQQLRKEDLDLAELGAAAARGLNAQNGW